MKSSLTVLIALLLSLPVLAQENKDLSRDSSYNNWYYASREKLYQGIKDTKVDFVFFGNSITERGPWHELITGKNKIANRGIGGDNTFGMKARISDVVKTKPKKLFLMMGINDIGRGLPTEWTLKNYEEMIKQVKQISPKTKIYIQSTLPLNEKLLKYDYLMGKADKINALNAGLQNLAKTYSLTYIDLTQVLGNGNNLLDEYTADGIHLNTEGYIRWVSYLKANNYLK